jgi:hypothetical protein
MTLTEQIERARDELARLEAMQRDAAFYALQEHCHDDPDFDLDYSEWQLERGRGVPQMEW